MLPGTLGLLVPRVLQPGPLHGYAITQRSHQLSNDVLRWKKGRSEPPG